MPANLINCPFCHEPDFDLVGLKHHFEKGYCDIYNNTDFYHVPDMVYVGTNFVNIGGHNTKELRSSTAGNSQRDVTALH